MQDFKNSLKLTKFDLKRTWFSSLIWIVVLLALTIFVVAVFTSLYGSSEDRVGMAETMQNPAMVAMVGPIFEPNNYTNGAMYAQMMLVFIIITVAIMNIFLIVNLTRKDEESSRLEVVRSLPVGRLSKLCSAVVVCVIINIILAILTALSLIILNIESMNIEGSILYAITICVSGIFFGSIAALFSQLASTSRGAAAYSFIFLGISYFLRGVGDVSYELLSLISPLGLPLRTQIYVNNYWWPVTIIIVLTIIVTIIAFHLNLTRDLGAGLIAAKPGKTSASEFMKTSLGLSVKLVKPILIGWGITILIIGIAYGSIFGDIEKFLDSSDLMKQIFLNNNKFTMAEQFMTTLMAISSTIVTLATLLITVKIRSEEKKGRLESIYSKKVSRKKVLFNYIMLSFIASIVFQFLYALGLWGSAYVVMEEPILFMTVFKSAFYYLPAIWLMISIAVILIAYIPKYTNFIWGFLGFSFFTVYIGKIANLPSWILKIVPYNSIPQIPVEDANVIPLIVLTFIAFIIIILAVNGYNKRDILSQE